MAEPDTSRGEVNPESDPADADHGPRSAEHLAAIVEDAGVIAEVVRCGPLDAPVRACPGWDLAALAGHLGVVHRGVTVAAASGSEPDAGAFPPAPQEPLELADWVEQGAAALVETLGSVDPAGPVWHPFPVPRSTSVWPRRQAQETVVHRWDAQDAVGATTPIPTWLAADGVEEYLDVMLPLMLQRGAVSLPSRPGVVVFELPGGRSRSATVDGDVLVTGLVDAALADAADATVAGSAGDLLLVLWGRRGVEQLELRGDVALAGAWLSLGGN